MECAAKRRPKTDHGSGGRRPDMRGKMLGGKFG
jgi:hypothetical protein